MKHASIAPSLDADIHLVLCRFGRAGLAYVETDPAEADATTVIRDMRIMLGLDTTDREAPEQRIHGVAAGEARVAH